MFNFNLENFRLEAAKYLKIGLPILGSQIVMYGLTTTDYIMAGLYSPNDLAGVGIAASIFNPIYFLTAGIMFGIGPIIAQHFGAKEFILIQQKTRKYLWYGLLIGSIFFLLLNNSWVVFNFLETDTKIVEIGSGYLKAISYGVFAMTIFQALRNYSEGITQTRIIFFISLLIFFLNIPLNYFFIFYLDFGGERSIILKGTQIGENSIIGAGSVVHGDIPPNSVYAGNPAKEVKKLDEGRFVTREELFNDSSTYLQDLNIIEENMLGNNSFFGWLKSMFWPKK